MKLLVISDLHCNHYKTFKNKLHFTLPPDDKFDILIICGDIADGAKDVFMYMKRIIAQTGNPVLFVTGNHCCWGNSFSRMAEILQPLSQYMNRTITEIDGQRYLGCTLWYKIPEDASRKHWSDFQYIIDWQGIDREYQNDQEFLEKNLQENDILITHVLPTWDCIDPQYQGQSTNKYFVSDIEDLIIKRKPKLICSGHSHSFMYKKMHDTLFLRNPVGYPFEGNKRNFQWLVFDTETLELKHVDADY